MHVYKHIHIRRHVCQDVMIFFTYLFVCFCIQSHAAGNVDDVDDSTGEPVFRIPVRVLVSTT